MASSIFRLDYSNRLRHSMIHNMSLPFIFHNLSIWLLRYCYIGCSMPKPNHELRRFPQGWDKTYCLRKSIHPFLWLKMMICRACQRRRIQNYPLLWWQNETCTYRFEIGQMILIFNNNNSNVQWLVVNNYRVAMTMKFTRIPISRDILSRILKKPSCSWRRSFSFEFSSEEKWKWCVGSILVTRFLFTFVLNENESFFLIFQ
jgi:hypothetical protein